MRRLLLVLGLAATFCLGACAPRVVRPSPKLGRLEDIHTKAGTYDGYSVRLRFEHTATLQGHRGDIVLTGHGRRPIQVMPGGRNVDSPAPPGTPNLRIDFPIMRGPAEVPRPVFRAGRIEGLDDDFMREQGWLFQDCGPGYSEFCEPSGTGFTTPSYKSVDPLIAYLGQQLKEGAFSYEEVDAAIAEWGRRIQEDAAKGELVI